MSYCPKCGADILSNNFCTLCGCQVKSTANSAEQLILKHDGKATASMILGICSLFFFYIPISIPLAITGIVFGVISKNSSNKNMSIAGIVLSVSSLTLSVITIITIFIYIIWVIGVSSFNE